MTHVLILYDGQLGKWNQFDMFVKWIQSLSYEIENEDGSKHYASVEPRIMVPLNLRVNKKARDMLLSDLKMRGNSLMQDKISKVPLFGTGVKKIDMRKVERSGKDMIIEGVPKNVHIGHVAVIGEVKDDINKWGEENL